MKVNIDREGCIGCGLCVEICPEVFRIADGDGLSETYKSPVFIIWSSSALRLS